MSHLKKTLLEADYKVYDGIVVVLMFASVLFLLSLLLKSVVSNKDLLQAIVASLTSRYCFWYLNRRRFY